MAKTVDLSKFAEVLGVDNEAREKAMRESIIAGLYRALPQLVEKSPVDTGHYASSWDVTEVPDGGIIGNTAPHAPIIEYGARPHRPPIGPLLEWAKRVLQDDSQPDGGGYSSEVWALARYTQNKIADRGQEPQNILEDTIDDIIGYIQDEYEKRSQRI